MQTNQAVTNPPKKRYSLASAWLRLGTRCADGLFALFIILGAFFAIFGSTTLEIMDLEPVRFFLFTLVIFVVHFIYFVFIPYCTNGFTPFAKLFGIRVFSVTLRIQKSSAPTTNANKRRKIRLPPLYFFWQLMLREVWIWGFFSIVTLFLGVFSFFFLDEVKAFLQQGTKILNFTNAEDPTTNTTFTIIFSTVYFFTLLVAFGLLLHIILQSRKRAFNDHLSQTVVVNLKSFTSDILDFPLHKKSSKAPKKQYNLPGVLDTNGL